YGAAARELYDNARRLLDRIVGEDLLTARAVYGFWPASSEGDDIVLFADEARRGEAARFNMLRQQEAMASGQANLSLADFVGPRDSLGAFAATAGIGADDLARRFEAEHDDYSAILVKAIATGLRRRPPRICTSAPGRSGGSRGGRPPRICWPRSIAASARRSAIRRVRITARSSSCSICCARARSGS